MFYANEIPAGAIDWSNKVYTTTATIWLALTLIVDWAEYFNFSFAGNILTLVDSPTLDIRIDYYDTPTPPTPWSTSVTVWEIKTKIRAEMVQKSTSSTYTSSKLMDMINEVSEQITDKMVYNELINDNIQLSALPFNEDITAFNIIDNPVTTLATAVGDITIDCVTTNLLSSWFIQIAWDVISYTGKTATQLTGVNWILLSHDAWSDIKQLYSLPSDFWKPMKFYQVTNWVELEVRWRWESDSLSIYYDTMYIDDWEYLTTKNTGAWWYYMRYNKAYNVLSSDLEYSILPYDMAMNALVFICAGRLIKDPDLRVQLLTKWYGNLAVAASKYSNKSWDTKKPRWKRFNFSSIR